MIPNPQTLLAEQRGRIAAWRAAIAKVRADYWQAHGRLVSLARPRRYTEKMQWRKLFDQNPLYTRLLDKIAVRDFVAARVGGAYNVPLFWTGRPEDLPFDRLVPPYVIKPNHSCGRVIMVREGEGVDRDAVRRMAAGWLAERFGVTQEEPGYFGIEPRLLAEKMLVMPNGRPAEEFRVFVFHGKVAVIQTVINEAGKLRHGAFYRPDWTRLSWHFKRQHDEAFDRPVRLAEMIWLSERLGRGLSHVRADFYDDGVGLLVGELTIYSWSGLLRFNPDEADEELGRYWRLRAPRLRAMAVIALRRRARPQPA